MSRAGSVLGCGRRLEEVNCVSALGSVWVLEACVAVRSI